MASKKSLLKQFFFNRKDVVAIKSTRWKAPRPIVDLEPSDFDLLLDSHLTGQSVTVKGQKGKFRVGTYSPDNEGLTKYLCFDIDAGTDHADPVKEPDMCALTLHTILTDKGVSPLLERSGGGQGWHVWVFFSEPEDAEKVREMARQVINEIPRDLRITEGGDTNGIEVFPKQNKAKNLGNMVWLPWWNGASGDGNKIVDNDFNVIDNDIEISSVVLPHIDTARQSIVRSDNNPWKIWREEALSRINLDKVYGQWLTGNEKNHDFLECRDPESPSGDKDPSAGVYKGNPSGDNAHERGFFYSFRNSAGMSIFDFMVMTGIAKSITDAFYKVAEWTDTEHLIPEKKPQIFINGYQEEKIMDKVWGAIKLFNMNPTMFSYNEIPVYLKFREKVLISPLKHNNLMSILPRIAKWKQFYGKSNEIKDSPPPERFVKQILGDTRDKFPSLDSVVTMPVFDPEGRVIHEKGFDRRSGIYYTPDSKLVIPDKVWHPVAGWAIIEDLLSDFPFASEADKVHAICGLLLPFVRRLIHGPTPLHYYEANSPGSGKTKLAQIASIIVTGQPGQSMSFGKEDDETRKRITSALQASANIIIFDNVKGKLESESFAGVLTSEKWEDRLLGTNKVCLMNNYALWMLTGNNLTIDEELTRRLIRIRLEPKMDKPWNRTGFKHPDLHGYCKSNRGELIWACLSIIYPWIKAGRPPGSILLGSFESWSRVMSGILEINGKKDLLLGNAEELSALSDSGRAEWLEFVECFYEVHGEKMFDSMGIIRFCQKHSLLCDERAEGSDIAQRNRLVRAFRVQRGKFYGGKTIELAINSNTHKPTYGVKKVDMEE